MKMCRFSGWSVVLIGTLLVQNAYGWPCTIQMWAYRQTARWLPPGLRLLVHERPIDLRPRICRAIRPADLRRLPEQFAYWTVEVPRQFHASGRLSVLLRAIDESARWVLFYHDPAVLRGVPAPIRAAFYRYTERHLPIIPPVFYGYRHPALERGDYRRWLSEIRKETVRFSRMLARPTIFGMPYDPRQWDTLDHRNMAFAIAALRLQYAITRTVQYWIYIWKNGGGSLRGLPVPYSTRKHVFRDRHGK